MHGVLALFRSPTLWPLLAATLSSLRARRCPLTPTTHTLPSVPFWLRPFVALQLCLAGVHAPMRDYTARDACRAQPRNPLRSSPKSTACRPSGSLSMSPILRPWKYHCTQHTTTRHTTLQHSAPLVASTLTIGHADYMLLAILRLIPYYLQAAADAAIGWKGHVDILFNNAGGACSIGCLVPSSLWPHGGL